MMLMRPPEVIQAEVFTTLPPALRGSGPSEWREGQPVPSPEHSLLEGPAFDTAGNLWCVDIAYGRIFTIDPNGHWQVRLSYDGEPNGLAFHRDGRLFVADYKNGIMEFDPATGSIKRFFDRYRLERLKAVNDLTFSSTGDLYFTDQGLTGMQDPTGRVFRVRRDGTVDCLLNNVPSPNGLVLSADEQSLFVAVTRANSVWRVPLLPDGGVAKVGVYVHLSGGGGPDGLALGAAGELAICHIGLGSVWLTDPRGEFTTRVVSPTGAHTTNVAFGGPENRTMFITEAETGTILRATTPCAGAPVFGLS
ncbi:MAG: SMP-30/gluconolactonase/LRE family protein [Devosia sp.]